MSEISRPISIQFLSKILTMISPENEEIIKWNEGGDGFIICDIDKFTKELMPRYFKTKKLSSFIRQLNFYGFHKVTPLILKHNTCEFTHPSITRDTAEELKRKNGFFPVPAIHTDSEVEKLKEENEKLKQMVEKEQKAYEELLKRFNELQSIHTNLPSQIVYPGSPDIEVDSSSFLDEIYGVLPSFSP